MFSHSEKQIQALSDPVQISCEIIFLLLPIMFDTSSIVTFINLKDHFEGLDLFSQLITRG